MQRSSLNIFFGYRPALFFSLILFILLAVITCYSEGTYGGEDDLHHYRMARYSFQYPEMLLDLWGKPVFTLFAAPFAQAGYFLHRLFNVLISILTGFFAFLLVRKLGYKNAPLAIIFVCFTPVYLALTISGMTEVFCSFLIITGLHFLSVKKYPASAVIISFLPYARLEATLLLPLFALFYLKDFNFKLIYNLVQIKTSKINKNRNVFSTELKKLIPVLLLSSGTLIYTIIGYFVFDDFLWLIHKMPYSGSSAKTYGSGNFFFYFISYRQIAGIPLAFLFLTGLLHYFSGLKIKSLSQHRVAIELLIILSFFTILLFHSFVWWLGTGAMALTRFIAVISPLLAIIALRGYNFLHNLIPWKPVKYVFASLIAIYIVITAFQTYKFPIPLNGEQKVIQEVCTWIKQHELDSNKIYHFNPYVWHLLDKNPHDKTEMQDWFVNRKKPEIGTPVNSLFVWDAHYGPNEEHMSLDLLKENPCFTLLKSFHPEHQLKTLGGYDYAVYVFQRIECPSEEIRIPDNLFLSARDKHSGKIIRFNDYEQEISHDDTPGIDAYSGTSYFHLTSEDKYHLILEEAYSNISNNDSTRYRIALAYYPLKAEHNTPLLLVRSIQHNGKIYYYRTSARKPGEMDDGRWNTFIIEDSFRNLKSKNDIVKIYLWNRHKGDFLIDAFLVEIL